ncbi:hypothetical protein BU17DRAFT_65656 [Hysterangium stoloniferum]|nr:hypothetical protein BU17DRAFT_65656 [Hysterangium stoloniferum]
MFPNEWNQFGRNPSMSSKSQPVDQGQERRFPFEVLQQILEDAIQENVPATISYDIAPLVYTRVSRYWKEVAEKTPALWVNVHVAHGCTLNPCSVIKMWIDRSRGRPLSGVFSTGSWPRHSNIQEAMMLVVRNFHRFHSFQGKLDGILTATLVAYSRNRKIAAPPLRELKLILPDYVDFPMDAAMECIEAPQLKTVWCEHPCVLGLISGLERLGIVEVNINSELWRAHPFSLDFLQGLTGVRCLRVGLHKNLVSHTLDDNVQFTCLDKLLITIGEDYSPAPFLDIFEAPNVCDFTVTKKNPSLASTNDPPQPPLDMHCLEQFFLRCYGQESPWLLQKIHLEGVAIDRPEIFCTILDCAKNIEELAIVKCRIAEVIIEKLSFRWDSHSSAACPCLRRLNFQGSKIFSESRDLVALVERRAQLDGLSGLFGETPQPLKFVDLRNTEFQSSRNAFRDNPSAALKRLAEKSRGRLTILL